MTAPPQEVLSTVSDTELRSFVEESVARFRGNSVRLVRLDRTLYDYYSSFAIEQLDAHFNDETCLQLIFKNLSSTGMLEQARQIRPHFAYQPIREIVVYRDILANAGLQTATCYGAFADADQRRYWLLLEKVAGEELYKVGSFSIWCEVARWLAQMHERLRPASKRYRSGNCLLRYDEDFCNAWIDRSVQFVRQRQSTSWCTITPRQLTQLADRCRSAARHLAELPVTIVHGEFYASNILIRQRGEHVRICPIDWETAAIGPGLIDLAALTAGNWTAAQKKKLAMAYYEAISPDKPAWPNFDDFVRGLQACGLLLAVKWLGWSCDWQPPLEHRVDWLEEAIQLARTFSPGAE